MAGVKGMGTSGGEGTVVIGRIGAVDVIAVDFDAFQAESESIALNPE